MEPLHSTKYIELINKSDDLSQTPYNIDLPILKGSLSTVIPKIISVSCVSSNSLNNDLQIYKLTKYRFPNVDVIDQKSDSTQYSQMEILENVLNISVCNLNSTNYRFWSELAQRDVKYKEITKLGLKSTKFDIKQEISRFKKNKEKMDYVARLKDKKGSDISTNISDISTGQNIDEFTYGVSNIDHCRVGDYTEKELNEKYFKDPSNLVSVLNIIKKR